MPVLRKELAETDVAEEEEGREARPLSLLSLDSMPVELLVLNGAYSKRADMGHGEQKEKRGG